MKQTNDMWHFTNVSLHLSTGNKSLTTFKALAYFEYCSFNEKALNVIITNKKARVLRIKEWFLKNVFMLQTFKCMSNTNLNLKSFIVD